MVSEKEQLLDKDNVIDAIISAIADINSRLYAIEEMLNENK